MTRKVVQITCVPASDESGVPLLVALTNDGLLLGRYVPDYGKSGWMYIEPIPQGQLEVKGE
jgi:hypothetical protein